MGASRTPNPASVSRARSWSRLHRTGCSVSSGLVSFQATSRAVSSAPKCLRQRASSHSGWEGTAPRSPLPELASFRRAWLTKRAPPSPAISRASSTLVDTAAYGGTRASARSWWAPSRGERRVHQDPIDALLHGETGVRCRSDAGVDHDRHLEPSLDRAHAERVEETEPASDRRGERHDGGAARVLEAQRGHQVLVGVGEDLEALRDQRACRDQQALDIGEQGLLVADYLELDELVEPRLAGEARVADGILGGVAPCGVGEQEVPLRVEVVEDALLLRAVQVHSPHRHGDDLGAGRFDRAGHRVVAAVLPRAHHEARVERTPADGERHVPDRLYGRGHALTLLRRNAPARSRRPSRPSPQRAPDAARSCGCAPRRRHGGRARAIRAARAAWRPARPRETPRSL